MNTNFEGYFIIFIMKENADLILRGDHVDLIPYRKEHVEKYHEWMKDPFLQGIE